MHPVIQLLGGIALLLWGTYMVKTGMLRTFGLTLRDVLSRQLKNRFKGFLRAFASRVFYKVRPLPRFWSRGSNPKAW